MKKVLFILLISLFFYGCSFNKQTEIVNEEKTQTPPEKKEMPLNVIIPDIKENDHILGSENVPITIIIYSDFQNPFAAKFSGVGGSLDNAKQEFGDKLAIVFRHYPQVNINSLAETAAEFAECAGEQDNFWQMHDKLWQDNLENKFTLEQFIKNVKELGLDIEKFDECLNTNRYQEKIKNAIKSAETIGLRGTPTLFVNGRHIIGALNYEDYESEFGTEKGLGSIIKEELEK